MNDFVYNWDKKELMNKAMQSVGELVITQCSYTDKLLKEPESLKPENAAMIETAFRALNHLSITLQRLQTVVAEQEKRG